MLQIIMTASAIIATSSRWKYQVLIPFDIVDELNLYRGIAMYS